nr:immunoglobulin heavy chain junction region [Mus musculus]NSM04644.1 immunoglobulin heavy chain junction region [Mus musculus]NSM08030.1 immunoglobulin heavy chain junction region [Mus musculus]NSM08065.1 immunoglobulin heavy chain junction region [Mus musculus]NSM08898.1 immunoglobulin heavy chain junction region [Mus musculus]
CARGYYGSNYGYWYFDVW